MAESTEKAIEIAPLNSAVTQQTLMQNVSNVLAVLNKNRYQNFPSARLIAVTKTVSPSVINMLKPLKILDIGENRTQVAQPKLTQIAPEFRLHWIGRLQTNKVKYIIDKVCLLHTLDRLALAQEIDRRAGERGLVLPTLVQVNIAQEPQKGGMAPDEVLPFLRQMRDFHHLHVEGLMSIMPAQADPDELHVLFKGMRQLFEKLRDEAVDGVEMRELSMGMSRDYDIAASEGATMVRVGSALYRE
ncbi:MAG: YggS family pyridoxal phosphate-dependent enzyme [Eubacteriales bacterium]|nr:YggS family pyridoxal phosphate-dependent enzyme [Eubacteriales bacterium]